MNRSGIIGVVLAVLGLILAIITCYLPNWTIMFTGNIANVQAGLWEECKITKGQKDCNTLKDPTNIAYLHAGRGMTIICILLSILALLGVFAVFTNLIKNNLEAKVCMGAGIALLVAGLFLLIPVSFSANHDAQIPTFQIGACIYTGWVGGVFLMLAGGLLFCTRRNP